MTDVNEARRLPRTAWLGGVVTMTEAARLGVGYQTLIVRMLDAGLAGGSTQSAAARVRVPAQAVRAGHLVLDVELVEP